MDLWHAAMLAITQLAYQCDHIQAKFPMRQGPASFFFGMIPHMIARAGRSRTVAHNHPELPESFQCQHFPAAVIGHPELGSALFTGLPKRCQHGCELPFGSRGSSR